MVTGSGLHGLRHLLIQLLLLLLGREAAMDEREQLGAEETDALGAVALARDAGRESGPRWR